MSDDLQAASSHHDPDFDHDISYGFLLKVVGGTVVGMVLVCAFIYWLYFLFLAQQVRADPPTPILQEASEPIVVPGPILLATPEIELDRMRLEDQEKLDGYGWVDEAQGVAHIEIDRALDLIVEREARGVQPTATEPATIESTPAPPTAATKVDSDGTE